MLDAQNTLYPPLAPWLRGVLLFTAVLDTIIGLIFIFAPELDFDLWPNDIGPVLSRFIGGIILANGVGSYVASRSRTWEGARALFTVGLVYGIVVLLATLYHLLFKDADGVFWTYVIVDAVFVGPIAYVMWKQEQAGTLDAN